MQLKRLKLHNFMQHRDLDKEISGNLICVCGPNGRGKSNFFGGMQFALTGEYPPWKRSDLVSWGEKDGYADLCFDDSGRSCEIVRNINTSGAQLTIGDTTISGATKVAEAMDAMLNVDKDLFKQVVFVRQKELDSILFTDPRQRELAFQKLMGIGDADKIYKRLGEVLTQYGKADFDEQIEEQKKRLSEAEAVITSSEEAIQELSKALENVPDEDGMQKVIKSINEQINQWRAKKEKIQEYNAATQELSIFAWTEIDNTLEELNEEDIVTRKTNLEHSKAILQEWIDVSKELSEIVDKLRELAKKKEACLSEDKINELKKQAEDLATKLAQAEGEERVLRKFSVEEGTTTCPLCGSHTDKDLHKDLEERIAAVDVEGLRSQMLNARSSLLAETMQKDRVQGEIDKLLPRHAVLQDRITKISEQHPELIEADRTPEALQADIDALVSLLSRLRDYKAKRESDISSRKLLEATISGLQGIVNLDTVELCDQNVSALEDQLKQAWEEFSKTQELRKSLAEYTGAVQSTRKMIDDLHVYIQNLEAKKKANDEIMARADIVQNVRSWFHYSNGPRTISTHVMSKLNADVNRFLGEFTAPFVVVPQEEGVGFKVRFTDGRVMPEELPDASVLSGGQKVMLAVAFRLATYCTFANKLGLLVLDEPTAYLDDTNIECFGELMVKISDIAKNLGLQILIATHERSLMPLFSSTIEL